MKLIKITFSTVLLALTAFVSVNAQENELFSDTFEQSLKPEWILQVANETNASWEISDGVLTAKAKNGKSGAILIDQPEWKDYSVAVEIKFQKASQNPLSILFRTAVPRTRNANYLTGFAINIYADQIILKMIDPAWRNLKVYKLTAPPGNDWHKIRIETERENIKCFYDGELIIEDASGKMVSGGVGLRTTSDSMISFRNFTVKTLNQ